MADSIVILNHDDLYDFKIDQNNWSMVGILKIVTGQYLPGQYPPGQYSIKETPHSIEDTFLFQT